MKTIKYIFLLGLIISLSSSQLKGQCFAGITMSPDNGSKELSIQFTGCGGEEGVFWAADDVTLPTGWTSTGFTIGNPCVTALDATDYMWLTTRTTSQRWLESNDMDLTSGGKINFEIRYGDPSGTGECAGPNHESQGVALEYSIDGGSNWTQITYYLPYSVDTTFTDWNAFEYDIPVGAQTASTRLRWFQNSASLDDKDRWG